MEQQYFLVSRSENGDKFERIEQGSYETIQHFSSRSPGYESEEALTKGEELLDENCLVCGGKISTHYVNKEELIKHRMCFRCNCFREIEERAKWDKDRMIVDGSSYQVVRHKTAFQGFGGRQFKFRRFDNPEEIVVSNNVWHQGDIPEIWKAKIPNNAEFVKE